MIGDRCSSPLFPSRLPLLVDYGLGRRLFLARLYQKQLAKLTERTNRIVLFVRRANRWGLGSVTSDQLPTEILDYVNHGREERNLEFKERLDWANRRHQEKLIKCVLGMSNIRNGGVLVIGVRDDGTVVGLNQDEARAYRQDGLCAVIDQFASPYAEVTVTVGHDGNPDRWFVVVQIREFEEMPVICRRDGQELVEGTIYTRSRRIHETAAIRREAEMREILDMAVEKRIRAFGRQAEAAGLSVSRAPRDRDLFDSQVGAL